MRVTLGDRPSGLSSRAPGGGGGSLCLHLRGGAQGWSLLRPPVQAEAPSFLHTVLSGHGACRGSHIRSMSSSVSRQHQAVFVEEPPCAPHWRLPASVSPSSASDPVVLCPRSRQAVITLLLSLLFSGLFVDSTLTVCRARRQGPSNHFSFYCDYPLTYLHSKIYPRFFPKDRVKFQPELHFSP